MKLRDFCRTVSDLAEVNLYDSYNCEAIDTEIDFLLDSEVISITANGSMFEVYIEQPTEIYYTYLDITYSARIEAPVPFGGDKLAILEKEARTLLESVPDGFTVNGYTFSCDWDNIKSGGFEGGIEKAEVKNERN